MKERLTELINERIDNRTWTVDSLADYLLAEGVIVPPFPIGTPYYRIITWKGRYAGTYRYIREVTLNCYEVDSVTRELGKTVFLTREEAEKALAEREGEIR